MSALEGVNAGKFACEEGLILHLLGRAARSCGALRTARDLDTTALLFVLTQRAPTGYQTRCAIPMKWGGDF